MKTSQITVEYWDDARRTWARAAYFPSDRSDLAETYVLNRIAATNRVYRMG